MAMDKGAADAYVYAKASGILSKSYIGSNASRLFQARSLQELWSLVFKTQVPVVPEALLAKKIEVEASAKFVSDYKSLISNYSNPSKIFVSFLHFFDYDNIKNVGAALCFGEDSKPDIMDISPYNYIDYKKWPDISAMTAKSVLSWYDKAPTIYDKQTNDYKLDCQYVRELWDSCKTVDGSCKSDLSFFILDKIRMDNLIWSLRLRKYYNMPDDLVFEYMAYSTENKSRSDMFVSEVVKTIFWNLDDWDSWRKWKYASLLNPHEDGVPWSVDPSWVYNAYKKEYVHRAKTLFHKHPFTECPLVCWFVLKQNELDNIRTASESLRLNVSSEQAMESAGVLEAKA